MNKAKRVVLVFFIIMLLVISILLLILKNKDSSEEILMFYGTECPHCAIVEAYIIEKNITLNIIQKEVYHNQQNALELQNVAVKCGINSDQIGVPLIFSKGKCYVGDKDAIAFLDLEMESLK